MRVNHRTVCEIGFFTWAAVHRCIPTHLSFFACYHAMHAPCPALLFCGLFATRLVGCACAERHSIAGQFGNLTKSMGPEIFQSDLLEGYKTMLHTDPEAKVQLASQPAS